MTDTPRCSSGGFRAAAAPGGGRLGFATALAVTMWELAEESQASPLPLAPNMPRPRLVASAQPAAGRRPARTESPR